MQSNECEAREKTCPQCIRECGLCDWHANAPDSEPPPDETEYDERTCITAGELRSGGHNIPAHVPDHAWVPRDSLFAGTDARIDDDGVRVTMTLTITAAFRSLR